MEAGSLKRGLSTCQSTCNKALWFICLKSKQNTSSYLENSVSKTLTNPLMVSLFSHIMICFLIPVAQEWTKCRLQSTDILSSEDVTLLFHNSSKTRQQRSRLGNRIAKLLPTMFLTSYIRMLANCLASLTRLAAAILMWCWRSSCWLPSRKACWSRSSLRRTQCC